MINQVNRCSTRPVTPDRRRRACKAIAAIIKLSHSVLWCMDTDLQDMCFPFLLSSREHHDKVFLVRLVTQIL
jgi:hypothetical protein